MGNIPPILSQCGSQHKLTLNRRDNSKAVIPNPPTGATSIRLSHFRYKLSKEQCFYVLNTLLQQYYTLFKQFSRAVVSDQLCLVTHLGEVKVGSWIDGPDNPLSLYTEVTHSFVTVVSQLLQMVELLACQKLGLQREEYSYFQQRIIKIIYQHYSDEEKLYFELFQEISSYMEAHKIKCNLLGAVFRLHLPYRNQKYPPAHEAQFMPATYLGFERARSQSQLFSQAEFRQSSSSSNDEREDFSTVFKLKDNSTKVDSNGGYGLQQHRRSRKSTYRHKVVRTEGQTFYDYPSHYHNPKHCHERYLSQAPPTTERPLTQQHPKQSLSNNSNHISAQYSIHIHSAFAKEKEVRMSQRVKFKKQSSSSCVENDSDERDWRKKTSIQEIRSGKPRTSKDSKVYTKSVLNDLARSVEVQEEPSSRSYIF